MNVVLLGGPGAGKGTLAEALQKEFNIPAVSTGNIIREAIKSGTEIGSKVRAMVESGQLLPDDVVVSIMKERLNSDSCSDGFILDGFPRTIPQAEALDSMDVAISIVLNISVSDEVIVERMSGRVVCQDCGSSYHLKNRPPRVSGTCNLCNGRLVKRKDDQPETVLSRLKTYHSETRPLIDYYKRQGRLSFVDGSGGIENLVSSAVSILKGLK